MDDSSSEEEDDDDVEMAMAIILNDDVRRPRLGSQFSRLYLNYAKCLGFSSLISRQYIFFTPLNIVVRLRTAKL
jgi:hypothetical protein